MTGTEPLSKLESQSRIYLTSQLSSNVAPILVPKVENISETLKKVMIERADSEEEGRQNLWDSCRRISQWRSNSEHPIYGRQLRKLLSIVGQTRTDIVLGPPAGLRCVVEKASTVPNPANTLWRSLDSQFQDCLNDVQNKYLFGRDESH